MHYFYFGACKDGPHPEEDFPLDNTTKFPNLEVGGVQFFMVWTSQGFRRSGKLKYNNLGYLNEWPF